jgi:hypothetical protein
VTGALRLGRRRLAAALASGMFGTFATIGTSGSARAQSGAPTLAPNAPADVAGREKQAPPLPAPGTKLAVPALELLDGRRIEPAQFDGQVLVLYWWASWCPFCALVSPEIDKLWRAQRARGLAMLTLSIDRKPDEAREYLRRRGYSFPAAWVDAALARALPKPKGLPVTLVRGRDGRVLQAEAGQLFPEDVEALARHL